MERQRPAPRLQRHPDLRHHRHLDVVLVGGGAKSASPVSGCGGALQVAESLSNQEAARLFLSPKTIEVHLGHIYGKLAARSRASLARLINSGAVQK